MEPGINTIAEEMTDDRNVVFALLFGSAAKGSMRKDSDLDVAVYFRSPPEGLELLDLINRLSNMTGRDVDIVVLNKASAFLRHQVMKHRVVLAINDNVSYRKFREKTIEDYEEYKYISGMNVYDSDYVGATDSCP
ncbi:MAG: nucleotidyltransferase domain-containing protein [Nitrospirae bacterium]|nr:nucleotidyltransferase domain-containing protein [Nitrospirota bacterium]